MLVAEVHISTGGLCPPSPLFLFFLVPEDPPPSALSLDRQQRQYEDKGETTNVQFLSSLLFFPLFPLTSPSLPPQQR